MGRVRWLVAALVLVLAVAAPAAADHDDSSHENMELLGSVELPGATDVVLTGDGYAIQAVNGSGEFAGLWVVDVRDPANPVATGHLPCAGSGYDIGLWNDIAVMSIDSPSGNSSTAEVGCNVDGTEGTEGIRLVDVSDRSAPREVAFLETDCGSHTNVTFERDGRGYVYVQSYPASTSGACPSLHGVISVVDITDPENPEVVSQPSTQPAVGCHDGAVHGDIAVMACLTEGQIWDISDPVNPVILSHLTDVPDVFWHSSDVSNDGSVAAIGFESFQAAGTSCNGVQEGVLGAIWFYDITDPTDPSQGDYWTPPRASAGICTAHNFTVVPGIDADVLVTGWYMAGIMALDFTDHTDVQEIAHYLHADGTSVWHANFDNGYVYAGDGERGLDIYEIPSLTAALADAGPDPAPAPAPEEPQDEPAPADEQLAATGGGAAVVGLVVLAGALVVPHRRAWPRRRHGGD